ncbi:hypothetical protein P152DRAFT_392271 [Eremomyces bilateralis CBS 781.70]|uniref:CsbD-like domain-containing protein n=1 Tax=Eremomyces bilateralis CBS 781.70 TaxID=1392243 RepID=A0A6G1GAT6_9PEZI|nr:uncharacterized protein P152DRAFT_392271 [Eremomyces bilateralis CBS 781.70]KAF1815112.1 hypothetical protein P152DRAFT_392271 [Eremomyces bilateralis CBS 781.70]
MTDKNTSTPQSYVDQVKGTGQSLLGKLTGNPGDQTKADQYKGESDARHDLSHTAAKAGPYTVSSTGATKDDHDRTAGSWNQTVGASKQAVGGLVGAEGLKNEGIRQNKEGQGQEAEGQMRDLGQGIGDRVGGTVGGAVAGLTGNRESQAEANRRHDEGKTRQRGVEVDLQKEEVSR